MIAMRRVHVTWAEFGKLVRGRVSFTWQDNEPAMREIFGVRADSLKIVRPRPQLVPHTIQAIEDAQRFTY